MWICTFFRGLTKALLSWECGFSHLLNSSILLFCQALACVVWWEEWHLEVKSQERLKDAVAAYLLKSQAGWSFFGWQAVWQRIQIKMGPSNKGDWATLQYRCCLLFYLRVLQLMFDIEQVCRRASVYLRNSLDGSSRRWCKPAWERDYNIKAQKANGFVWHLQNQALQKQWGKKMRRKEENIPEAKQRKVKAGFCGFLLKVFRILCKLDRCALMLTFSSLNQNLSEVCKWPVKQQYASNLEKQTKIRKR